MYARKRQRVCFDTTILKLIFSAAGSSTELMYQLGPLGRRSDIFLLRRGLGRSFLKGGMRDRHGRSMRAA
jgi:hypothetical protein